MQIESQQSTKPQKLNSKTKPRKNPRTQNPHGNKNPYMESLETLDKKLKKNKKKRVEKMGFFGKFYFSMTG